MFFLNASSIKRGGGGVKGFPLGKKILFLLFFYLLKKIQLPLSLRGGGGWWLNSLIDFDLFFILDFSVLLKIN